MSSHTASLKTPNHATLEGMNGCIGKEPANEPHIPKHPFNAFQHEFNSFSTCLQQLFVFFDKSLVFFVFASKVSQLLITSEAHCHFAPPRRGLLSILPPTLFS
jgi:hypothetical protein